MGTARVPHDRLGCPAARHLLDAGQLAPDRGRGRVLVDDCGATVLFASPETAAVAARIAAGLPGLTAFVVGHSHPGLRRYGTPSPRSQRTSRRTRSRGCTSSTRPARPAGQGHPQGDHVPAVRHRGRPRAGDATGVRLRPGHRLPVPGAAVPRGAPGLVDGHHPARWHSRGDGAIRPGRVPARHPRHHGHGGAVRADALRPDAQAAAGHARGLRHRHPADGRARRRALPGRGQAADDRLARPRAHGVLRRQRG